MRIKWEYKVKELESSMVEDELDELGENGWELIDLKQDYKFWFYTFKRELI